jgi:acetyltransferase
MALPPLDDVLGRDLISRTHVSRLLEGYRDVPGADIDAVLACLNGVSQMVVDFPALKSLDINPLLANHEGVIALDARVEIDPQRAGEAGPNKDLPVRPYPEAWERTMKLSKKEKYLVRPIKPADIALYEDFFEQVTPEDMRFRFLSSRRRFSEAALKRLTQIDYEREMAFVALEPDSGRLAAVARLASDPDGVRAEYGVLVRSDLQRHGIGHAMLDLLIEYARSEELQFLDGYVLSENSRMLDMCREMGFDFRRDPDDAAIMHVSLKL